MLTASCKRWRSTVMSAIAGTLLCSSAVAESTAEAIKKFGLIGTWAADCTKQPIKDYSITIRTSVEIQPEIMWKDALMPITSAVRLGEDKIEIALIRPAEAAPSTMTVVKSGVRIRIWSFAEPDGNLVIEQGRMRNAADANRLGEPLLERCDELLF